MIAAVADDYTGAAELGGIGLRHGLNVELHTSVPEHTRAGLLIIATDTRSMSAEEAIRNVSEVTRKLLHEEPIQGFFKKTDSVLRGHVIDELKAVRKVFQQNKILLVPCNPSLNRRITNGIYYIGDHPIHTTSFVHEYKKQPETSQVAELLNAEKDDICVLKPGQSLYDFSFVVGEASKGGHVEDWANQGIADQRIMAGGSDFFSAYLKTKGHPQKEGPDRATIPSNEQGNMLLVWGSASETSRNNVRKALKEGRALCSIPSGLFEGSGSEKRLLDEWVNNIIRAFGNSKQVIIGINKPLIKNPAVSKRLCSYMAAVTAKVLDRIDVRELLIEGGSTAAAVIKQLGYKKFIPVQEFTQGVVRMQVSGHSSQYLTLKPGSYTWPEKVWNPEQKA